MLISFSRNLSYSLKKIKNHSFHSYIDFLAIFNDNYFLLDNYKSKDYFTLTTTTHNIYEPFSYVLRK